MEPVITPSPAEAPVSAVNGEAALGDACAARGDWAGAAHHFRAAFVAAPGFFAATRLAMALCMSGNDFGLLALVNSLADPEARIGLWHGVLRELMTRREWDVLARLRESIRRDETLTALVAYYAGCGALACGRHDVAMSLFDQFRTAVLANPSAFPRTSSFNLIFRQAWLPEPPAAVAELAALPASQFDAFRPRIEWLDEPGPQPPALLLLCGCDAAYFRHFAPELRASLARWRPDLPLHFHIVAPDAEALALMAALAKQGPPAVRFSVEREPRWRHHVYYACDRFLAAPALMDRYDCPVAIIDVDSVLLGDLRAITDAVADYDFACFETGRTEPASVFQATFTYFSNAPGGRRFLELLARLILLKLDQPPDLTWMLDQAALYSAVRYGERYAPEIRVGDLAAITGRGLRDHIAARGTTLEKARLIVGEPV